MGSAMKRNKTRMGHWTLLMAAALMPTSAQAFDFIDWALGLRAGTPGIGAELGIGLGPSLNLRLPANLFKYKFDVEEDDVDYDGKLKLQSFGAVLDYHPFQGAFFVSAGVFSNGNRLDLFSRDENGDTEYRIGDDDRVYRSDSNDPLTLTGHIKFGNAAPYLGLGWGNAIQGVSNAYFRFEVGVLFQGQGRVGLGSSGSAIDTQSGESFSTQGDSMEAQVFRAELAQERELIENDISDYELYPVMSFAVGYRF